MKKLFFTLSILLIFLFPFLFQENKTLNPSFYHWDNTYSLQNPSEKLYIKVLDIAFSNKLEVIKTKFITKEPSDYIPTIYITNEAMKKTSNIKLLKAISKNLKSLKFNEIQIDCDWSLSTKAKYFELLKQIKTTFKTSLSSTIRLHQIKYANKTGIPPVDYGVLMYYNMSTITNINTKNSILDNEVAKKYHYNFDTYPLKLKLALPLYSQGVQFRENKALDIFEGIQEKDFKDNFKAIGNNKYQVLQSTYFKGRYVYKDDIFRFEDSTYEDIQIALSDFLKLSKNSFDEIIFYTYKYKKKYDLEKLLKETK